MKTVFLFYSLHLTLFHEIPSTTTTFIPTYTFHPLMLNMIAFTWLDFVVILASQQFGVNRRTSNWIPNI